MEIEKLIDIRSVAHNPNHYCQSDRRDGQYIYCRTLDQFKWILIFPECVYARKPSRQIVMVGIVPIQSFKNKIRLLR